MTTKIITPDEAAARGIHVRPEVRKHFPKFIGYIKQHNAELVDHVLQKGQSGKARLYIMNNRRDRYQMRQLLGFVALKENGA